MPQFEYESTSIYFEVNGSGFPLLVLAPGGMSSTVEMWDKATVNPLRLYTDTFQLIAMDQRNSGRSFGPLDLADPWASYARDQLALLDHLGVDRFHIMGCCIGGSFALKLIERAPERVAAAVLEQPVGIIDDNRHLFDEMWRAWGARLTDRPDVDQEAIEKFGNRMWRDDFVVSVSRDFVRSCRTPLLVLPGIDPYHPTATGREIGALAPAAQVLEPWKDSEQHANQAAEGIRAFLEAHVPQSQESERPNI